MNAVVTTQDKATLGALETRNARLTQQVNELTRQFEWFKRQLSAPQVKEAAYD